MVLAMVPKERFVEQSLDEFRDEGHGQPVRTGAGCRRLPLTRDLRFGAEWRRLRDARAFGHETARTGSPANQARLFPLSRLGQA